MRRCLIWLFALLVSFLIFSHFTAVDDELEESEEEPESNKSLAIKTIVLWTSRYGKADWKLNYKSDLFKNCPEQRCKFVQKREMDTKNIHQYDAFLFYQSDLNRYRPIKRYPHQIYAFVSQEAPLPHQLKTYNHYDNFFNYTCRFKSILM